MQVLPDEWLDHLGDNNEKLRERENHSPENGSRDVILQENRGKRSSWFCSLWEPLHPLQLWQILDLISFNHKLANELRQPLEVDGSSFLSWQFILGQDAIGHMVLRQCAVYCSLYKCNSTTFYVLFKVKLMSITVWSWVCKALIHSICIWRAAPPVSTSKCPLSLSILRTLSNWIWRTCFWKHKYLTGFEIAHVPFLKKLTFNLFSPIQL